MLYNEPSASRYMDTAGKITLITVFSGVLVFAIVFLFNVGKSEVEKAIAQSNTATTTLTVLNTPPNWIASSTYGQEETESSTSTPTNSGDEMAWIGYAIDSNGAPYFMIVCAENVAPVPNAAAGIGSLGTEPPDCAPGVKKWAVSPAATSGEMARAATTTSESFPPFGERNEWYAWVCDDDPVNPRCNTATSTGANATNSAPFHVNRRPVFTDFGNNGPVNPSGSLTFLSTSSDPDVIGDTNGGEDTIYLVVCGSASYSTVTNTCSADFIASTTLQTILSDASATYTIPAIIQDQAYDAFGYVVDEHGHEASGGAEGGNVQFTVNNVAPTVSGGSIVLNGGSDITLTVEQGETTGFTLQFVSTDANSCVNSVAGDEVTGYVASVFRSGISTSTCDGSAGAYDANNCYTSGYSPWNLSCTASSSSCTGATDATMVWDCTFPLWYIADPTDSGVPFETDSWSAAISAVDDDNATGTYASSTSVVDLISLTALAMNTLSIPYGALEPGDDSGTLSASTTILATGNTGLDENLSGADMCTYYTAAITCVSWSATSTIPANQQQYATSSIAYGTGASLSSTTPTELELNVNKTTATATPAEGYTFWGIAVPGSITLAGSYTGRNSFEAVRAEVVDW